VTEYIDNQVEHHSTRTFCDEFLALLTEHEIDYDESYLWS
jgi:hypothetical protein